MGLKMGELLILLLIVMIFFGSKRLPSLGGAIGEAIKNFKKGIGDPEGKGDIASKLESEKDKSKEGDQKNG